MRIRTDLPHEKSGGHTIVLFGKPRIKYQSHAGHMVYIDCHVITAKYLKHVIYDFKNEPLTLSEKTIARMRTYAKKLAQAHINKKGWKVKSGSQYIQNANWYGFYFKVN